MDRHYFQDSVSGVTQWDAPADYRESGWIRQYSDEHSRHYWENKSTSTTQWNEPSESWKDAGGAASASTGSSSGGGLNEAKTTPKGKLWFKRLHEGHNFYENIDISQTQWDAPPSDHVVIDFSDEAFKARQTFLGVQAEGGDDQVVWFK